MKADLPYFIFNNHPFFYISIIGIHKKIQIHLLLALFLSLFIIFHHHKDRINL